MKIDQFLLVYIEYIIGIILISLFKSVKQTIFVQRIINNEHNHNYKF
jgi:hypothetical protein